MHRPDRLAYALDKAVIVGECTVNFREGSGREDDIGKARRIRLEQLLHDKQIEFAQRIFALLQMRGQKTSRNIHCANRLAGAVQQFKHALVTFHHVVRADAVIEKWQRMQQYATNIAGKNIRQLRDDRLGLIT